MFATSNLLPAALGYGLALFALSAPNSEPAPQSHSARATWQSEGPVKQQHGLELREASAVATPALYTAALASPTRSLAHRERDANRKPVEVLTFFGIQPGMTVLDVNASSGYYSEILAGIVGEEGKVWAQNTQYGLDNFSGEDFYAMLDRNRERAVTSLICNPAAIATALAKNGAEPGSLDVALIVRNYHDWPGMGVDRAAFNQAVFAALKPGGVFGVVDHHAQAGTGLDHCQDLHRIDALTVIEEVSAAGFELEAESDCLANPEDTRDWFIWKERGRWSDTTDRFVFRFRKPLTAGKSPESTSGRNPGPKSGTGE